MNFTKVIGEPTQPCPHSDLKAIERALGVVLPEPLWSVIASTGGGEMSFDYCFISLPLFDDPLVLDRIFGFGTTSSDLDNNIASVNADYSADLDIPAGTIAFAEGEGGFHELFLINYSNSNFPVDAILYWDNEAGDGPIQIASDCAKFFEMLSGDPDSISAKRSSRSIPETSTSRS